MKIHLLLVAFISFICSAGSAPAQIKILSAYYGRVTPEKTVDVKDTVQAIVDSGKRSMRVGPGSFAVNPNPGRRNFLAVTYYAYGQKQAARAEDGDILSFQGGPVAPPAPRAAAGERLRFENGYGRIVFLYELDRWGAWSWRAQLEPGSEYAVNARPGDLWAVSDRNGRTLQQVRVPKNLGVVRLQ